MHKKHMSIGRAREGDEDMSLLAENIRDIFGLLDEIMRPTGEIVWDAELCEFVPEYEFI